MEIGKCICFFTCVMLQLVSVELRTIKVGGSDNYNCGSTYTISDTDDSFMISWDGRSVTNNCKLSINGENELKVCALLGPSVMNCQETIKIYEGSDTRFKQVREVTCGSSDVTVCSDYEGMITVKFIDANTASSSNVTIKVYGEIKDADDDDDFNYHLIQPIATAAGVVLVVIATAVGWCIFLKISKKREQQRKAMLSANPPT
ncbi:uncharacterized protein LOC117331500 [Pecten maximus]|uniref:uncharacterized protein LOC117331500 n=1 Tax=Pecten maximus TaxID=6579 RepID=UPI0014590457|nr:uncharacterized protein LOC117331500 [Pecten maximus]XP_033746128.1 uncharacterized protein LOC117331500 [Pecten maximus]XP_033746129.1 uncharacterized protein LOC117331500 [Pecten maximus]